MGTRGPGGEVWRSTDLKGSGDRSDRLIDVRVRIVSDLNR